MRIIPEEVESCFARPTTSTGGNHDRLRLTKFLERDTSDSGCRVERRTVSKVHGFAVGDVGPQIVKEELFCNTSVEC